MHTREEVAQRLAAFLQEPERSRMVQLCLDDYFPNRRGLLSRFPFLLLMMGSTEEDPSLQPFLPVFEGMFFQVHWVEKFGDDPESIEACRRKLASILAVFGDDEMKFLHDPNLAGWAVLNTLAVELCARKRGLGSLLRGRERDMLTRVLADASQHFQDMRCLPKDLPTRLRALEAQGIMLPSDIYTAVELVMQQAAG